MRVLVVGGAGRVGAMVVGALSATHQVRVADKATPQRGLDEPESVIADVTDYQAMRDAAQDQDALVYLAMGRRDWRELGGGVESHFDVNVKGLYLTLRAAADTGVRKVVHASTLSIFHRFLEHGHKLPTRTPDEMHAYGLTKRLGEQVCESVARERALPIVSLRLCGPLPDDQWRTFEGRCPAVMTAATDVGSAFVRALDYDGTGHETFIITGDHEHQYIDHSNTRDRLGWQPVMRRETVQHG